MDTSDLVARARGLSAHLLRAEQIALLCAATPQQLPAQLSALGAVESAESRDVRETELALRRVAAQRLHVLARWTGDRARSLAPLFEDEDVRSLRVLVRRIVAGMPAANRTDGLIPTPSLPARVLQSLGASGDIAHLANRLVTIRNPYGEALAVEAARSRPELFRFDVALSRVFAERARSPSRDPLMRRFTQRTVDLANLWTTLVVADHHADVDPSSLFVKGGQLVNVDDIAFAMRANGQAAVAERLGPRVTNTPLAAALETIIAPVPSTHGRDAEDAAFAALIAEFRALALREPTSLAPVIAFVLRQRAELRTLLRIVWSVSLGIPAANIRLSVGVAA